VTKESKDTKQYSIKFDLSDAEQRKLNDFLKDKPTTYIITEAIKLYMRFEDARKAAVESAISSLAAPQYRAAAPVANNNNNDDLEDFDL
jgi:predicted transcriptional regulator